MSGRGFINKLTFKNNGQGRAKEELFLRVERAEGLLCQVKIRQQMVQSNWRIWSGLFHTLEEEALKIDLTIETCR